MKKADIYISDSNSFSDIKIEDIKIGLENQRVLSGETESKS